MKAKCARFWTQFRSNTQCGDQKEFFQIIHYCHFCFHIKSVISYKITVHINQILPKKLLEWTQWKRYEVLGPIWSENIPFWGIIWVKHVPFEGQKFFFKNIYYCHYCFLIVPYHTAKLKKILVVYSKKKVCRVLSSVWDKDVWFRAKKTFFKLFTIVTHVYLECPIVMQKFKKILRTNFEKKVYEVLGQFGVKGPIFWGQ